MYEHLQINITKPFSKEDAIHLMLDGYKVVEITAASKRNYRGEFCCYIDSKFTKLTHASTTSFDANNMINKFWQLAEIPVSKIPPTLYKTNLKSGIIIELTFHSVESEGLTKSKDNWVLASYGGSDGRSHGVKMTYTMRNKSIKKPHLDNFEMEFWSENIETNKKDAQLHLKNFVERQMKLQNKRHISKPEIESMKSVRAIIENHPEALI